MNRETIKTFILVVLVGLSFLLSYILWSYQPKYELFYDASYINEADVGGKERTKNELIKPSNIVFHDEDLLLGFVRPTDRQALFQEIQTWELTNVTITEATNRTIDDIESKYVEITFPSSLPAGLLTSLFNLGEEIEFPNWSFDRVYIILQEHTDLLEVQVFSVDKREQFMATVEKIGPYQAIKRYDDDHPHLQRYVNAPFGDKPIYIPEKVENVATKTLVANLIDPDRFINALFSNPALVKPNRREAFFTDGQRGMRVFQEGRYLEFINPIQTNDVKLEPIDLLDKTISHINEHKGWFNEYWFDSLHTATGKIQFRLHYDYYPVFDFNNLTVMEQIWREQELYQYQRSLIQIGNLLNVTDVELPSGEQAIQAIEFAEDLELDKVTDIQLGYYLNHIDESHSVTLEPAWFMLYDQNWIRIPFVSNEAKYEGIRGD